MKRFLILMLVCVMLVSCSAIKDDMPVQILAEELGDEIDGFENMTEASTDYIKYCMDSDLSLYSEYIVLYPFAGTVYNEIGIFKVKNSDDIDKGISEVEKYLAFKKDNWDTRYNGEEFKKIENAEVTTLGKYILYTILDVEDRNEVKAEFKNELK